MTTGPTRRDESVQFSLKELLKLEDERLDEQSRLRQAREETALREQQETERRHAAEALARERAQQDALDRHRSAELDELARREAMQKAVIEQARLEVDVRARAEERERERRHELEIARLRGEAKSGQSVGSLVSASLLGGAVMLAVMLGIHFGVTKPNADRQTIELRQGIAIAEERAADLDRRDVDRRRMIGGLQKDLADAQSEITALKAKKPTPPAPTVRGGAHPPPPPPPSESKVVCQPGDPLCPVIPRGR